MNNKKQLLRTCFTLALIKGVLSFSYKNKLTDLNVSELKEEINKLKQYV